MGMLTDSRDDAWVREQIAKLPGRRIASLQRGPLDGCGCRVCRVLTPLEAFAPDKDRPLLATGSPATDLLDYHAVDGPASQSSDMAPPELRNECYRRCVQIYRCAGWADAA